MAWQFAVAVAPEETVNAVEQLLSTIDQTVFGLAVVRVIIAVVWWVGWSRRDPLRVCPLRPNRVREDSLALAVFVYLAAAMLLGAVARALSGDAENAVARVVAGGGAQIAGIVICLLIAIDRFDGGLRRFCFGSRARVGSVMGITVAAIVLAIAFCPVVLEESIRLIHCFAPGHEFPPHPTITALHEKVGPWG